MTTTLSNSAGKREEVVLVPKTGFEPARGCPRQNLNLVRLPVPPLRRVVDFSTGIRNLQRIS
jgi:hypothetical protein